MGILFVLTCAVHTSLGQLREMEVTPEDPPETIPVFRNHPDEAAVIIFSSLTDLQIESNMGIVEDLSQPADGRYVLMVGPFRQVLTVRAPGFQETRVSVPNMDPREVRYFSIEPKEREPVTGRGTLFLRSIPEGAQISVDGYPDFDQQTPYTFDDWSAQSYRMRVELDLHEPKEFIISIPEGRVTSRTLELTPLFGTLRILVKGTLRVRYEHEDSFTRLRYHPQEPVRLPPGTHALELSHDHYETETREVDIAIGSHEVWTPQRRPTYGELRVEANVDVALDVEDNVAPQAPEEADFVYIESGSRTVRVTAEGYMPEEFDVNVAPETRMDTTITLISVDEASELARREEQPRGIIMAASDLDDTEIWINGEMSGVGEVNLPVLTGSHEVEFRHSGGRHTENIHVAPGDIEQVFTELRPAHGSAIALNIIAPGTGFLYTGRSRGYFYGAAFLGVLTGSAVMWSRYNGLESDYKAALSDYEQASTLSSAAEARRRVNEIYDDRMANYDLSTWLGIGAAAIYAVSMMDIIFTRPENGYRTGSPPEGFSFDVRPGSVGSASAEYGSVAGSGATAAVTYRRSF